MPSRPLAPSIERPLSVAELELLRLAEAPQSSMESFTNALTAWPVGGYRTQILTPRLWDNLRFESNFRYYGAEKIGFNPPLSAGRRGRAGYRSPYG
jgi:hypothetical protein